MNKIIISGRMVATPELKSTTNGTHVTHFTVAVDRNFGENKKTDFIDCVAWRKTADFVTKYFFKGKPILIEGILTTDVWEDRDGKKRKTTEVLVDNAEFCGGEKVSVTPRSGPTEVMPESGPDVFEQAEMVEFTAGNEEELPF